MYLTETDPTHTCTIAVAGHDVVDFAKAENEPRDDERKLEFGQEYSHTIDPTQLVGDRMIGRYRLKRHLGRGMTGSVWLAQDVDSADRDVALKIMHADVHDEYVMARYTSEVRAMARMDDPHIARIWENGQTLDGKLYIAMEYVNGVQLARYCETWSPSVRDRILLAISICRGLEHAHQRGILHRDLKPANILVTKQGNDIVPKLIDFGLAKSFQKPLRPGTADTTQLGCLLGTIGYMSPEQANTSIRDVDTRSDVYSVCAMLYELLSGTLPIPREELYQVSLARALQMIQDREAEPVSRRALKQEQRVTHAARCQTTPAKLSVMLQGDLDAILEKGLSKEKKQRYQSARELAEDLERYLTGGVVQARRRTTWYVTQKLARRHWKKALAASLLTLVFLVSWVGMALGIYQANVERDRARQAEMSLQISEVKVRQHKNDVERSNQFLESILSFANPGNLGAEVKLLEALDAASGKVAEKFAEHPRAEGMVRLSLARSYLRLGRAEQAAAILSPIFRETMLYYPEQENDRHRGSTLVAQALMAQNNLDSAERFCLDAIEKLSSSLENVSIVRSLYQTLAEVLELDGRFEESDAALKRAMATPGGKQERDTGEQWGLRCSQVKLYLNWAQSSPEMLEQALQLTRYYLKQSESLPDSHPCVLQLQSHLADLLQMNGEPVLALQVLHAAFGQAMNNYGPENQFTMLMQYNLARLMISQGQFRQSKILLRQILPVLLKQFGPRHQVTQLTMLELGKLSEKQGLTRQGLGYFYQLYQWQAQSLDSVHPRIQVTKAMLQKVIKQVAYDLMGQV